MFLQSILKKKICLEMPDIDPETFVMRMERSPTQVDQ